MLLHRGIYPIPCRGAAGPGNRDPFFTNNRGSHVMEAWQKSGAALEIFEDCVLDIDAWIRYVLDLGYRRIVLQGHSLGTEKVVYYMSRGNPPPLDYSLDSVGGLRLLRKSGLDRRKIPGRSDDGGEAVNGRGPGGAISHFDLAAARGCGPQERRFLSEFLFSRVRAVQKPPLRQRGGLSYYRRIQVPTLVVVGEFDPFTCIPVRDALELLAKRNRHTRAKLIAGADHDFSGKGKELAHVIRSF